MKGDLGYVPKVESFNFRIAFANRTTGITEAFKADSFAEKINLGTRSELNKGIRADSFGRCWRIP